jgi:CheY-like chemotaxis protein
MSVIVNQRLLERNERKTGIVLLVEDNEANAEFISTVITEETLYDVLLMRSGHEVLQRLQEIKESQPILLLLDYLLPGMNGLELYNQLHAQKELMHVPAIILTASLLSEDVRRTFAQLGVHVLEKPFELNTFLASIEQAIACTSV